MVSELIWCVHVLACLIMVGVIWSVQIVHYPAFKYIDEDSFKDFCTFHQKRISYIVMPLMMIEVFSGGYLWVFQLKDVALSINFFGLVLTWLSTFLLSMPLHSKLVSEGKDLDKISSLVRTNWPRTLLWTLRAMLLVGIYFLPMA